MSVDVLAEYSQCQPLRQQDIDGLLSVGAPSMALVRSPFGGYSVLGRDLVHIEGPRFEFDRHVAHEGAVSALVWPAFDAEGSIVDLVAWRPPLLPAVWLGTVSMLGEENLYVPRLGEPLRVHPDPVAWLKADRQGVCIVDVRRAPVLLREAGSLLVSTASERCRLREMLSVPLPHIQVDAAA